MTAIGSVFVQHRLIRTRKETAFYYPFRLTKYTNAPSDAHVPDLLHEPVRNGECLLAYFSLVCLPVKSRHFAHSGPAGSSGQAFLTKSLFGRRFMARSNKE